VRRADGAIGWVGSAADVVRLVECIDGEGDDDIVSRSAVDTMMHLASPAVDGWQQSRPLAWNCKPRRVVTHARRRGDHLEIVAVRHVAGLVGLRRARGPTVRPASSCACACRTCCVLANRRHEVLDVRKQQPQLREYYLRVASLCDVHDDDHDE